LGTGAAGGKRVKSYNGIRSRLVECLVIMHPLHWSLARTVRAVNAELDYYMRSKRRETGIPGEYMWPVAKLDVQASKPGRLVYQINL